MSSTNSGINEDTKIKSKRKTGEGKERSRESRSSSRVSTSDSKRISKHKEKGTSISKEKKERTRGGRSKNQTKSKKTERKKDEIENKSENDNENQNENEITEIKKENENRSDLQQKDISSEEDDYDYEEDDTEGEGEVENSESEEEEEEDDEDSGTENEQGDDQNSQKKKKKKKKVTEEEEKQLKEILEKYKEETQIKKVVIVQSCVRRAILQKSFLKKLKMNTKRNRVVNELLTTERTYVSNLSILLTKFLQPLSESVSSTTSNTNTTVITRKKKSHIDNTLNDIRVILGYNSIILRDLEKRIANNWSPHQKLGDIFLKMGDFMKTYIQYMQHYEKILVAIGKMSMNQSFSDLLESLRVTTTLGNQGVRDFLIIPVQRIPRYILLLKDLVNNTWEDHPDYNQLQQALQKITSIAQVVDKSQEAATNINKVTNIQSMLSGKLTDELKLVQPSRRFVREGDLSAIIDSSSKDKIYHVFLFNDLILWTKIKKKLTSSNVTSSNNIPSSPSIPSSSSSSSSSPSSTSGLYELVSFVSLLNVIKQAEIKHGEKFAISLYTKDRLNFILFDSEQEREQWSTDLKNYINQTIIRDRFLKGTLTPRTDSDSAFQNLSSTSLNISSSCSPSAAPSSLSPSPSPSPLAVSSPPPSQIPDKKKKRNSKILEMKQRLSGSWRRKGGVVMSGIKEEGESSSNSTNVVGQQRSSHRTNGGSMIVIGSNDKENDDDDGPIERRDSSSTFSEFETKIVPKRPSLGIDLFTPPP